MSPIPCTAIVTAHQRVELTLATLEKIHSCEPCPDEVIVHVDGNQAHCESAIRNTFPDIQVIRSDTCIGPGGGRNRLIAAARNEAVASFDDDSYPTDKDYFSRVLFLVEKFPAASIFSAAVYQRNENIAADSRKAEWVADFIGCGCIYRRSAFLATSGYVPLPVAYGMEEADLALRLHARGAKIMKTPWLRVFHDTDLRHHADPTLTALRLANLALLTYLRYPPSLWLAGFAQCLNLILWLIRHRRTAGIFSGLRMIPGHLRKYGRFRELIERRSVRSYWALRKAPIPVTFH